GSEVVGGPIPVEETGRDTTRCVLSRLGRVVPSGSGSPRTSPRSSITIASPSLKLSKSPPFWMRSCNGSDPIALAPAPVPTVSNVGGTAAKNVGCRLYGPDQHSGTSRTPVIVPEPSASEHPGEAITIATATAPATAKPTARARRGACDTSGA